MFTSHLKQIFSKIFVVFETKMFLPKDGSGSVLADQCRSVSRGNQWRWFWSFSLFFFIFFFLLNSYIVPVFTSLFFMPVIPNTFSYLALCLQPKYWALASRYSWSFVRSSACLKGGASQTPGWGCRHSPGRAIGEVAVSFVTSEGANSHSCVCFSTHFQKSGASSKSKGQTFLISRQFKARVKFEISLIFKVFVCLCVRVGRVT